MFERFKTMARGRSLIYAPEQLERARLVSALRQLEMPLARIAHLLELPEAERARSVEEYWRGVEDEAGAGPRPFPPRNRDRR